MPETAQEYIARILSNSEGQDGLAVLGQTAGRLKALLDSSSPEKWRRRPAPDAGRPARCWRIWPMPSW